MKIQLSLLSVILSCGVFAAMSAQAVTTGTVPADGVFKFTFGTESVSEGFAVPASAVYDASHEYANTPGETFTYGFMGTTDDSWQNDVPWSLPAVATAIDGFKVVEGQRIVLHDVEGRGVTGPTKAEYLPAGASAYEGRYPVRFSMSAEKEAYYAVTCTVANVSSTASADVTLFSERCHIQAHHLTLAPDETRTFAWSVELFPNVFKASGTYVDDAINIVVVGENAALKSLTVVKQPQVAGTIRGVATEKMNVGRTMWLCDDSTGTDQRNDTPYFSLQNYSGVGSGLSRYAPANLSIRNQGEGGLATGDVAHRKSCMLKPGDYLYVEYGHNESSTESYTNNLETYLSDANAAGANLIIVSPVERRSSWNSEISAWNRSLSGYATAGEAWVNDKIAKGATNVAFIDLNRRYSDWMNEELQRIHAVNPAVSLNAAISYYYRSAKGNNVDNTHINNAGTDQAAYWVWYDALQRVAAGEAEGATESQQVQAAVLKGITEGYQGMVGLESAEENLPWQVTDEIINAGMAPNTFWDTPVTTGAEYVHDAAVASVDATAREDGSMTISGVTMRILNPRNYYKAVIEVESADGETINCYYSYYNYDVGGAGKQSGDLVTPEEPGFLTADRDKAEVTAPDCMAIEIPAGARAWVWIAEADAATWQVGENAPCSAKYPLEWWSRVIVEEPCEALDEWKVLTQAIYETNVVDRALSFMSTGADANNTKKNFGLYRALDADTIGGRYRISFKVRIDAGSLAVKLGDAINSTTTLFVNEVRLLALDGQDATGYQSLAPSVTVTDGIPQARVNMGRWVDVDLIVDRDNAQAWLSVGGSDYAQWTDPDVIPGAFTGRTWKYVGVTMPAQQSSFGAIDEVKIVKLSSVAVESDRYDVDQVDFSAYAGEDEVSGSAQTVSVRNFEFHLTADDKLTTAGLTWKNSANTRTGSALYYDKYVVFKPETNGRLTLCFSVDAVTDKRNPTVIVSEATDKAECTTGNKVTSTAVSSASTAHYVSVDLTAGKTYYIWPYSYNWSGAKFYHNYTLSSITYTYVKPCVISVDENVTTNVIGAIEAAGDVVKTGAGTLTLFGNNSFAGELRINAGTLRLAGLDAVAGLGYRWDFSDTTKFTYDEAGLVTNIVPVVGGASGTLTPNTDTTYIGHAPPVSTKDVAVFGGRAFLHSDQFHLHTAGGIYWGNSYKDKLTTFAVAQYPNAINSRFIGDWSDLYYKLRYDIRTMDSMFKRYSYNNWVADSETHIYVNGQAAQTLDSSPFVMSTRETPLRDHNSSRALYLGSGGVMNWGEVLLYERQLSDVEMRAVEQFLSGKWGIASYTPIPAETSVSVASGATLDLGDYKARGVPLVVSRLVLAKGARIAVDAIADGKAVITAGEIVDEGAEFLVGQACKDGRFKVIDNGDGTKSLVYCRRGFIVILL